MECAICCEVVSTFGALGVPRANVGVTSPYQQQVRRLQRSLSDRLGMSSSSSDDIENIDSQKGGERVLAVMTIDRFQGCDKEAMVLSLVRSNAEGQTGALLADCRRVNVALTRAKHKMVIVGDSKTVQQVPMLQQAYGSVQELGLVVKLSDSDVRSMVP
jgi:superfamily I DNA and/or RNA helicase